MLSRKNLAICIVTLGVAVVVLLLFLLSTNFFKHLNVGNASTFTRTNNIPRVVHQTWKTKDLQGQALKLHENHNKLNQSSGWVWQLYDDNDMYAFARTQFDARVAAAFNSLNLIVQKADLWRLLKIWRDGGVYCDMDVDVKIPLDDIIPSKYDAVFSMENRHNVAFHFFAARAKHPFIGRVIEEVLHRIETRKHANESRFWQVMNTTGPGALTDVMIRAWKEYHPEDWIGFESSKHSCRLPLRPNLHTGRKVITMNDSWSILIYSVNFQDHVWSKCEKWESITGENHWAGSSTVDKHAPHSIHAYAKPERCGYKNAAILLLVWQRNEQ